MGFFIHRVLPLLIFLFLTPPASFQSYANVPAYGLTVGIGNGYGQGGGLGGPGGQGGYGQGGAGSAASAAAASGAGGYGGGNGGQGGYGGAASAASAAAASGAGGYGGGNGRQGGYGGAASAASAAAASGSGGNGAAAAAAAAADSNGYGGQGSCVKNGPAAADNRPGAKELRKCFSPEMVDAFNKMARSTCMETGKQMMLDNLKPKAMKPGAVDKLNQLPVMDDLEDNKLDQIPKPLNDPYVLGPWTPIDPED